MTKKTQLWLSLGTIVFSLGFLGCAKQKAAAPVETPPVVEAPPPPPTPTPVVEEPSLAIGTEFASASEVLGLAYFDYNKADLRADARDVLKKNAAVLKSLSEKVPTLKIRVDGHCDSRGTVEYNLALGQKRADAVRNYYKSLGVKATLSSQTLGKDQPLCGDEMESCWWRNRRSETVLKAQDSVKIKLQDLPR